MALSSKSPRLSQNPAQGKPKRSYGISLVKVFAIFVGIGAILSSKLGRTVDAQDRSIQSGLRPLLSNNATIHLPGSAGFTNKSTRWSAYNSPNISAVVSVASEQDIQQIG